MSVNTFNENGWRIPPEGVFEWLNEGDSWFERIKIYGQEYIDFKEKEILALKRIASKRIKWKRTPIPELFLFTEFTLTKPHKETLLRELGKYVWKSVEVMYIDWYTSRWILQFTGPNIWFDDITKLWNQIIVEGQYTRDYVSYSRMMREGVYIRIIDNPDSNWLKEDVSWRVNRVFNYIQ